MSDYDLTKRRDHPLGWNSDPVKRGEDERRLYGADRQSPQQPSESWADYQRRTTGTY